MQNQRLRGQRKMTCPETENETMSTICRFCQIAAARYSDSAPWDVPFLASDDAFAIPSIGALVEGWSLVVSKRHVLNLSADYGSRSFQLFRLRAASHIRSAYGPLVSFEHGAFTESSLLSCGTSHAHLHFVPSIGSLSEIILRDGYNWLTVRASEIQPLIDGREYFFYSEEPEALDPIGMLHLVEVPSSQYFRRVVATKINLLREFNYRLFPHSETAERTSLRLRTAGSESIELVQH